MPDRIRETAILILLITIGVIGRLLIETPNVTPITTVAIIAGLAVGWKRAMIVPISAMLISDTVEGFYSLTLMATVYGCFLIPAILSRFIGKYRLLGSLAVAGGSATVFFIITNFMVWWGSGWYPQTLSGLTQCYIAAIPFYKNMLIGDLVMTGSSVLGINLVFSLATNRHQFTPILVPTTKESNEPTTQLWSHFQ